MSDQNEMKASEVQQLVDLLQYQEGAVVSRVLLKNKGGTVTLVCIRRRRGS